MKTKETSICRKCGSEAKYSKALLNQLVSFHDFGNDVGQRGTTQSRVGKAALVDCMKCTNCGHSWIPDKSTRELALKWWDKLPVFGNPSKEYYVGLYYSDDIINPERIEQIWSCEIGKAKISEKPIDKFYKSNKKQFKEFNPELFKAYINKFSDDDKLKALSIILNSFENLSVGSRNATSEDENYSALVLYSGTKELLEYKTRVW